MEKNTAAIISSRMSDVSRELNQLLLELKGILDDDEFDRYRTVIGKLMGEVFIECLMPIYDLYPDLMPDELKSPP